MRRKRHEPLLPEALDEPFGPPPEEYRYRCPVCGEAMLVNEAIIDVAIGAAKFGDPVAYGQKTARRLLAVYRRKSLRSSPGLVSHCALRDGCLLERNCS